MKRCRDHLDNEFNSIKEMCEYWNVDPKAFSHRVNRENMTIEEALTYKSYDKTIKFRINAFGHKNITLSESRRLFDISDRKLNGRYDNVTEAEILIILSGFDIKPYERIQLEFIGLDGKAYYKVPWNKDYVTTEQVIKHYRPDLLDLYNKSNKSGVYNQPIKWDLSNRKRQRKPRD